MDTNDLVKLLPSGYEQACFDKKAITRKRTVKNPPDLLRLLLFYLYGSKSFIDVSRFALISGIGKISDVGFMKRFIKCKEWIVWLTQHILPNPVIQYQTLGSFSTLKWIPGITPWSCWLDSPGSPIRFPSIPMKRSAKGS